MTPAFFFLFSLVRFLLFPTLKLIPPTLRFAIGLWCFPKQTCISYFCSTVWEKTLTMHYRILPWSCKTLLHLFLVFEGAAASVYIFVNINFLLSSHRMSFLSGKWKDHTSSRSVAVYKCSLQKWLSLYFVLSLLSHSLLRKNAAFQITLYQFHQQFWLNQLTLL